MAEQLIVKVILLKVARSFWLRTQGRMFYYTKNRELQRFRNWELIGDWYDKLPQDGRDSLSKSGVLSTGHLRSFVMPWIKKKNFSFKKLIIQWVFAMQDYAKHV